MTLFGVSPVTKIKGYEEMTYSVNNQLMKLVSDKVFAKQVM